MREIFPIPAILLLTLVARGPRVSDAGPALEKVVVVPLVIVVRPLEGAPARSDADVIMRRLAEEATARAERSLLRQGIAAAVERLHSPVSAGTTGSRAAGSLSSDAGPTAASAVAAPILLTGTVRLPLSIPRRLIGARSWFHHGPFATAEVQVRNSDGTVITREEVTLDWNDIRWFNGAGRMRYGRPLDDVLVDFARKATDHAIKRLKQNPALLPAPGGPS